MYCVYAYIYIYIYIYVGPLPRPQCDEGLIHHAHQHARFHAQSEYLRKGTCAVVVVVAMISYVVGVSGGGGGPTGGRANRSRAPGNPSGTPPGESSSIYKEHKKKFPFIICREGALSHGGGSIAWCRKIIALASSRKIIAWASSRKIIAWPSSREITAYYI